jgi:hypothetical protein
MGNAIIVPQFEQSQDKNDKEYLNWTNICPLCDGIHGNNTFCQADFTGGESYVF